MIICNVTTLAPGIIELLYEKYLGERDKIIRTVFVKPFWNLKKDKYA
jgi:hypothetical protein